MADMNQIIKHFPEVGEVAEIKALTSGLINQTYLVKTAESFYYLSVFFGYQIYTSLVS